MEVWCPSSLLARSFNNDSPSCAPGMSGWPVCHYLGTSLTRHTVSKRIPGRSLGVERDVFGRRTASTFLAGRFRVLDASTVGNRLKGRLTNRTLRPFACRLKFGSEKDVDKDQEPGIELDGFDEEDGQLETAAGQVVCWMITVVYVGWLFLLPYAPGDPVWAITPSTIQMLLDQSFNFFYVLPLASILANAAGIRGLTAPVQHPTSEALFNFVLGWTLLFAPLLFTDKKRERFSGSLEALWIIQMFLTNTVLAPYMAIRQNRTRAPTANGKASISLQEKLTQRIDPAIVSRGLTSGAFIVGVTGALVGIVSVLWAVFGRPEAGFGGFAERWEFFLGYVGSERLAYAFVWDIALYAFFQPWLIGDNLGNVKLENREAVRILRFVPYVGLVAYVFGLQKQQSPKG